MPRSRTLPRRTHLARNRCQDEQPGDGRGRSPAVSRRGIARHDNTRTGSVAGHARQRVGEYIRLSFLGSHQDLIWAVEGSSWWRRAIALKVGM